MKICYDIFDFIKDESGSVAVEFSFVLIPLFLFLIGSFETARFFWTRNAIEEIAVSASRCMALRAPSCSLDGDAVDLEITSELIKSGAAVRGIHLIDSAFNLDGETICSGVNGFSSVEINDSFSSVFPGFVQIPIRIKVCFPNQQR